MTFSQREKVPGSRAQRVNRADEGSDKLSASKIETRGVQP